MRFAWALLLITICGCSSDKPELHLYMWGDYVKPEILERFEAKYHCQITVDTYDSNEAMFAKLKAGAAGYDLIFPSNYIVDLMVQQDMLSPIDLNQIPNIALLDRPLLEGFQISVSPYYIPYTIGYTGLAYRSDRLESVTPSWSIFGDQKLKHRMTMLNDIREALGAALLYLRYSPNTIDPYQIKAAETLLREWKENLAKFESEQYRNGLATAEYLVSQGYSGDILQLMREDPNIKFIYPKEGSGVTCDYFVIPKNSQQKELSQKLINYLLSPEIAEENMEFICYLCPILPAYALLDKELKHNPALFMPEEIRRTSYLIKDIGPAIKLYTEAWDEVRSSH